MHLFAAFLGGDLGTGRMGEDHEVVFVVAEDAVSATAGGAKAKCGAAVAARHIDALTRLMMVDGYTICYLVQEGPR